MVPGLTAWLAGRDLPPLKFKRSKGPWKKVKSRALAERTRQRRKAERKTRRKERLERRAVRREDEKLRRAENGEPPVTKAKKCVRKSNHGTEKVDATILKVLGRAPKCRKVASKSRAEKVETPEVAGPKWRHGMREERHEGRCVKAKREKKSPAVQSEPKVVEEKQGGEAEVRQVVPIDDVGPDYGADGGEFSNGDGAVELVWPLPIQSPLEPMPLCMEFYKVRKQKHVTVSLIQTHGCCTVSLFTVIECITVQVHAEHLCTPEAHLGSWPAPPPNSILAPPFFTPCQAAKLLLPQKPLAGSSADLTNSLTSSQGSDEAKVKDDAEGGEAGVILDEVGSDLEVDSHWNPYTAACSNSDEEEKESEAKGPVSNLPELVKDHDQDDGLTASSSSNDEAEEDKSDMTSSSSSGEAMDALVRKSKRFVKRRVEGTRRPAESSDDEDEGTKQQRRRRKFSGRVNAVPPLTSCDSRDEALSEEINISSEWLTSNYMKEEKSEAEAAFSEEINISSERPNKLSTEEKTKPAAALCGAPPPAYRSIPTPFFGYPVTEPSNRKRPKENGIPGIYLTESSGNDLTATSEEDEESGAGNMRGGAGQTYEEVLMEAIHKSGQRLVLDRPTRGDGNCCSRALVQQCHRAPVKLFLQSRGVTIDRFMQLKLNVYEFIQVNSNTQRVQNMKANFEMSQHNIHKEGEGLRKRSWEQYWADMCEDAGEMRGIRWVECWADDIWLQAAAWYLNMDIHIIWAGDDTQGRILSVTDGNWSPVGEGEHRPHLFLGYIVNAHYQSLLPVVEAPLPKCVAQPALDKTLQDVLRAVEEEKAKQATLVSSFKCTVHID